MSSTRQDAWTHEEDLLLAEIVLRQIREGGTQLQAFEIVGKQLSRTAAACGFRWNSYVRKQYKQGIELAKKQRKNRKLGQQQDEDLPNEELHASESPSAEAVQERQEIEFDEMVQILKTLYDKAEKSGVQSEDIKTYEEKIQTLEKQLYYLAAENEKLVNELNAIEKDYKSLIEIMERARKMVGLKDSEGDQKVKSGQ